MGRAGGLEICHSPALRGTHPAIEGPADVPPGDPGCSTAAMAHDPMTGVEKSCRIVAITSKSSPVENDPLAMAQVSVLSFYPNIGQNDERAQTPRFD